MGTPGYGAFATNDAGQRKSGSGLLADKDRPVGHFAFYPMRTCTNETWTRLPLDAGDIVPPGRMWQGCRGYNAQPVLAAVVPMTST